MPPHAALQPVGDRLVPEVPRAEVVPEGLCGHALVYGREDLHAEVAHGGEVLALLHDVLEPVGQGIALMEAFFFCRTLLVGIVLRVRVMLPLGDEVDQHRDRRLHIGAVPLGGNVVEVALRWVGVGDLRADVMEEAQA